MKQEDKQLKLATKSGLSKVYLLVRSMNKGIVTSKLKVGTVVPKQPTLLSDDADVELEIDAPDALVVRERSKQTREPIDTRLDSKRVE